MAKGPFILIRARLVIDVFRKVNGLVPIYSIIIFFVIFLLCFIRILTL